VLRVLKKTDLKSEADYVGKLDQAPGPYLKIAHVKSEDFLRKNLNFSNFLAQGSI